MTHTTHSSAYTLLRRFLLGTGTLLIVFVSAGSSTVHAALTGEQKSIINAGIGRFDIADETLCGSGDGTDGSNITNGTTLQNQKAAYEYFVGKGLKPFQAAGIVGNMTAESGVLPQRKQGTPPSKVTTAEEFKSSGSSAGWGIVQFTPGSKFIDNAPSVHAANALGTQLDFIWKQLEGGTPIPEKRAGDDIKATTNIRDAVLAWQGNRNVGGPYIGYERPADERGSVNVRLAAARFVLQKFGNGATEGDASGNASTNETAACAPNGSDNSAVGGFVLPVDQKWYDQHPDWFTKPHHSYPSADIPVPTGTKVYAAAGGKIVKAPITTNNTSYGNGVEIDVGNGILMIYAHGYDGGTLSGAHQGDTVKAGQLIMHSDDRGNSTGPHLHFEIRVNRTTVCPQSWLNAIGKKSATIPAITSLPRSGCTY